MDSLGEAESDRVDVDERDGGVLAGDDGGAGGCGVDGDQGSDSPHTD